MALTPAEKAAIIRQKIQSKIKQGLTPTQAAKDAIKEISRGDYSVPGEQKEKEPTNEAESNEIKKEEEKPMEIAKPMEEEKPMKISKPMEEVENKPKISQEDTTETIVSPKDDVEMEEEHEEIIENKEVNMEDEEINKNKEVIMEDEEEQLQVNENDYKEVLRCFESLETLSKSFVSDSTVEPRLDVLKIIQSFEKLDDATEEIIDERVIQIINTLSSKMEENFEHKYLRGMFILLLWPSMFHPEHFDDMVEPLLNTCTLLLNVERVVMKTWMRVCGAPMIRTFLNVCQQVITISALEIDDKLTFNALPPMAHTAIKMMSLCHEANEYSSNEALGSFRYFVDESSFENDTLEPENINFEHEFIAWKREEDSLFDYPHILNIRIKSDILHQGFKITQSRLVRQSFMDALFGGSMMGGPRQIAPYNIIRVRREAVLQDVLQQFHIKNDQDLQLPLRVEFVGEQGVDAGGLRKEMYQLVLKQLFDPSFGMFHYFEKERLFWFNGKSLEPDVNFELIGILLGVAIYNDILVEIQFPQAVFKKFLHHLI